MTYNIIHNQVVVRGTSGQAGITPHIDPITKNWMIGDTDTGVPATCIKSLIERYENKYQLPLIGSDKILYLVKNIPYIWNKEENYYEPLVPDVDIIQVVVP